MSLFLDVGPNDMIRIGDTIVTVERKSGSRARLRIDGPSDVELVKNGRIEDALANARPKAPVHERA